jgi:hypothetical protein
MITNTGKCHFICEKCHFKTNKESNYKFHLSTTKHKNNVNDDNKIPEVFQKIFKCNCGKEYKHAPSLWNHKKICTNKEPEISLEKNINNNPLINVVDELLKNNEFKIKLIELISKTLETVGSPL